MDANAAAESREVNERPQVSEVVNRLIDEHKMPGTIGRNFSEDYLYEGEDEACSKSHERTLIKDAAKEMENNLDPVSGLEVWKAVKKEIIREQHQFVQHVAEVYEHSATDEEAVKKLVGEMTISARMTFIGRYQDILTGHEEPAEKWRNLRDVVQEAYILSEHSKRAEVACDAQGLKNTNDAAKDMRVDMSGEEYVDNYGFQEWGRKKQALSVLLGSSEYSGSLNKLNGTTIEDQYNDFATVEVGEEYYLKQVLEICKEKDLLDAIGKLKDRGVMIIPFREGDRGDESGVRIIKEKKDEKGYSLELEKEDIQLALSLISAVSETNVAKYAPEDMQDIKDRAQSVFGDRNKLTGETVFYPSFLDRAGYVRHDEVIKNEEIITTDDQLMSVAENPDFLYKKIAAHIFTQSRKEMEKAKRIETYDLMFDAINGNASSQQKIIELVRQNRFPGSIDVVTSALNELQQEKQIAATDAITKEDFDARIGVLMFKREDEKKRTEEQVEKNIYPDDEKPAAT